MTSYNPINGHWSASNYDLNTVLLRKEWGYNGMVMTDWWAQMNDCATAGKPARNYVSYMVRSQNDVYMVINNNGAEINSNHDDLEEAVEKGTLTIGELQRSAMNILRFILASPVMERPLKPLNPAVAFASVKELEADVAESSSQAASTDVKKIYRLSEKTEVAIGSATEVTMKVDKAGIYNVIIKMMSPFTNLSQSSTNAFINGERFTTIQTCGTDGRWITEKMMRVTLEEGYYTLRFEVAKPGIEIEYLAFELV